MKQIHFHHSVLTNLQIIRQSKSLQSGKIKQVLQTKKMIEDRLSTFLKLTQQVVIFLETQQIKEERLQRILTVMLLQLNLKPS